MEDAASQVLLGPNRVIGEIYSSGWNHYMESFANKVSLASLAEPDILAAILTYRGATYTIPYNEIVVRGDRARASADRSAHLATPGADQFESRMLYVPSEGRTTTLLLYGKLADFSIQGSTATFSTTVRDADDDVEYETSILLYLSDRAARILAGK